MAAWWHWDGDKLVLSVHLQPRASSDAVCRRKTFRIHKPVRLPSELGDVVRYS